MHCMDITTCSTWGQGGTKAGHLPQEGQAPSPREQGALFCPFCVFENVN